MSMRKALTELVRGSSLLNNSFASKTQRVLAGAPRVFNSSAYSNQSKPEEAQSESEDEFAEPETVGWGSTTVGKLLHSKVNDSGAWLWCSKDDWVIDAIRKMTHANVGSLLVFDVTKLDKNIPTDKVIKTAQKSAVVGIFTERDYLTKVVVKGKQSTNTKVSEIMTPADKLMTVTPSHSVLDVMELMVEKNFRHVPVADQDHMAGMVSIRDVVHVMLKEHREEVGRLQEYIQGTSY